MAKSYPTLKDFLNALSTNYKKVRTSAIAELKVEMLAAQGELVETFFSRAPSSSGQGLARRTGVTANSFKVFQRNDTSKIEAGIESFSVVPLYHLQQTDIAPKNAKFLTIPAEKNMTSGGRVRFPTVRSLESSKGKPTWIFNRAHTGGIVGYPSSKGAGKKSWNSNTSQVPMDIYFYLTKHVRTQGRLSSFSAWADNRMRKASETVITNVINEVKL